jgi:hypothetical protein
MVLLFDVRLECRRCRNTPRHQPHISSHPINQKSSLHLKHYPTKCPKQQTPLPVAGGVGWKLPELLIDIVASDCIIVAVINDII